MRSFNISEHLSLANSLYTQTALNGGCSINVDYQSPKSGYLVSIKDGLVYDNISSVNVHELSAWIKENLTNKDNVYFGGWIDTETKKVYFDLSQNIQDRLKAIAAGTLYNQIAIYDVSTQCETRLK